MAKKTEFSIATVKKYIFWVCVPLGLIFSVVVTFLAVGNISKAFSDRKNTLENQKKQIEQIRSKSDHPNEKTIQEIESRTKELRGRVFSAWRTLEDDQRKRNLWPREIPTIFANEVVSKKHLDELSINALEAYLNFVERYIPTLEYYVDRRRVQFNDRGKWKDIDETTPQSNLPQMPTMPSMGGGGGSDNLTTGIDMGFDLPLSEEGEEMYRVVGVVDWPAPETRTVTSSWGRIPKSAEVWFAQEELWVYNALLWVIKTSNAQATGPHNAVVKRIENLLIGQLASQELATQSNNRIGASGGGMDGSMSMDGAMGGGMGGGMGSMSGGMGGDGMSGSMGSGMMARTEEEAIMLKKHYRYVDDKGTPLGAEDAPPFEQFNRMPICLRLVVDQRYIPEILVNCANSAMPIDVLWVRINPAAAQPYELSAYDSSLMGDGGSDGGMMGGGMGGSSMGGSGMGGSSMGGMSGSGRSGGSSRPGGSSGGDDTNIKMDGIGGLYGTNAIPIEIYGCINIFNPVEHGGLQEPRAIATEEPEEESQTETNDTAEEGNE